LPKIVDWETRRDEVLAATWQVISREGLAKTTVRKIAKQAGYSNGILAYYFTDKDDILSAALRLTHQRVSERIQARMRGTRGLEALRTAMEELLPLDEPRLLEAEIEVSFWGQSLGHRDLAELQNEEFDNLLSGLRAVLGEAEELGELRDGLDLDLVTHRLALLVDGLSVQRVLYPAMVPPERQVLLLDELLGDIRKGPPPERWVTGA
jgi:AcrR family transcriptional regulator